MSVALAEHFQASTPVLELVHPRERRTTPRRKAFKTHWLTISSVKENFSSFIVARLVDVGEDGLGLLTLDPVPLGHEYGLSGEVDIDGECFELWGHAESLFCEPIEDGMYRVGMKGTGIHSIKTGKRNSQGRGLRLITEEEGRE